MSLPPTARRGVGCVPKFHDHRHLRVRVHGSCRHRRRFSTGSGTSSTESSTGTSAGTGYRYRLPVQGDECGGPRVKPSALRVRIGLPSARPRARLPPTRPARCDLLFMLTLSDRLVIGLSGRHNRSSAVMCVTRHVHGPTYRVWRLYSLQVTERLRVVGCLRDSDSLAPGRHSV